MYFAGLLAPALDGPKQPRPAAGFGPPAATDPAHSSNPALHRQVVPHGTQLIAQMQFQIVLCQDSKLKNLPQQQSK